MRFRDLIFFVLLCLSASSVSGSLSDHLTGVFNGDADEILAPEQAFRIDGHIVDAHTLEISWDIESGYYLYQDKFSFHSQDSTITVREVSIPQGEFINDPLFGRVAINVDFINLQISLQRDNPSRELLALDVGYQGCKKDSVCYPPTKKTLNFVLPTVEATTPIEREIKTDLLISEQDVITQRLIQDNLLANIIVFFSFGLLLSFTPCVFPMVPILSGVIVGQSRKMTTGSAFSLSLTYVLAMALTYSILGMIAGFFHFNLQVAAQNAWVISGFSLVFVLLALSMFGFYEIQLPTAIRDRLIHLSQQQAAGNVVGVAVMGSLAAIIVGPCVAPPLAGVLLYISQTGNVVLGGLALFAMGLGFGVPLLVIGTSAGKLMPRTGIWMDRVKAVFGVVMLGIAIWFLQRILPDSVTLLLWAALITVSAIFMGALDHIEPETGGWRRLWKGLGLVMFVYGVILVLGAVMGGKNVLHPIPDVLLMANNNSRANQAKLNFKMIKTTDDLKFELQQASLQKRTVMLDFYAKWCVDCNEMETHTFSDPEVQQVLGDLVLLKVDITNNDHEDQILLKKFGLFGPPAILFFDVEAQEQRAYRLVGFIGAEDFIRHIHWVTNG